MGTFLLIFFLIGYYSGLGDILHFLQEMPSNYSLCQLIPRIKAFKSLCVITIMHMNNLGHPLVMQTRLGVKELALKHKPGSSELILQSTMDSVRKPLGHPPGAL